MTPHYNFYMIQLQFFNILPLQLLRIAVTTLLYLICFLLHMSKTTGCNTKPQDTPTLGNTNL